MCDVVSQLWLNYDTTTIIVEIKEIPLPSFSNIPPPSSEIHFFLMAETIFSLRLLGFVIDRMRDS